MKHTISDVMICRADNIGDLVLTLPLAAHLKHAYPGIKIGMLCRSYAAALPRNCRFIDYVVEVDKVDIASYFASAKTDTIVFAQPNRAIAAEAKKAGVRIRIGTSHRFFNWLYCNKLAHFTRARSPLHEAQLNFALLRPLGLKFTPETAAIPAAYGLTAPKVAAVDALLDRRDFNLIFHPKSNGHGREWPIAHYTALAQQLAASSDIKIWLTGSASEGQWLEQHAGALLGQPNVSNLCGHFDLDALMALIHTADGLIASGTGPLHIAAALGTSTLGLFPPIRPIHPGRWAPLGLKAETLVQAEDCQRCTGPTDCACMNNITPDSVAKIALRWHANKQPAEMAGLKVA